MHGFRIGKSGPLKRARLVNQIEGFQTTEKLEKKISQFINLMHMTWADPDSLSTLTDLYNTKNKFKPKLQRTSQNHTCRRGLLAPRSFIMFASVVLLNVSVSSGNKRSTNQRFRTKTLITLCRNLHLNICLYSAVVWLRIFTCRAEKPI